MSLPAIDLPDVRETLGLAALDPEHVERFGTRLLRYTADQVQEYAATLLSAAREEGRTDPRPSPVGREEVARVIASALGDHFDHAFANKAEWNRASGENGGRYRDINEPMQDDYLSAADAILALFSPVDGWRPIETAPKDELVLLFGLLDPHPEDVGLHSNLDRPRCYTGYWCGIDEAWCVASATWLGPWLNPTHWQPLPPAPPPPGGQG